MGDFFWGGGGGGRFCGVGVVLKWEARSYGG